MYGDLFGSLMFGTHRTEYVPPEPPEPTYAWYEQCPAEDGFTKDSSSNDGFTKTAKTSNTWSKIGSPEKTIKRCLNDG